MVNQLLLSPPEKPSVFALHEPRMGALESLVGSLEFSSVTAKLALSVGLPLFGDDTDTDGNDTTLNDEEWLSSPTQKKKFLSPPVRSLSLEPLTDLSFAANGHLCNTSLHSFSVPHDVIPRIDVTEFHKLITGEYANRFDRIMTVDCRFPYEYEGGHIENAINISLLQLLEKHFALNDPPVESNPAQKTLLVFHCEYSLLRGPTMALHLRKLDRLHNADRYPYLTYPDILVLEGGYKSFFDKYTHLCTPQGYVEMRDRKHKKVCEVEMNKVLLALKLMRTKSNVSKPRPSFAHTRSSSLSSSTASIESQANNQPNQLCIRRSGLKKVHKRNSRDSRPLFTQSLHNLSQDTHEHTSAYAATYNNDYFAPLPMLYANHGQSLSALLLSVDSLYSVAAHSSTDSSTDSLMGSSSPFTEVMDDLDLISSKNASNVVLASASARPRVTLTRLHTRLSAGPPLFSPTVSLPFFDAHAVDDLSDDSFLTADHL